VQMNRPQLASQVEMPFFACQCARHCCNFCQLTIMSFIWPVIAIVFRVYSGLSDTVCFAKSFYKYIIVARTFYWLATPELPLLYV